MMERDVAVWGGDRAAIDAGQDAALRALLDRLLPDNRFYARKLEGAVLSPTGSGPRSLLDALPFTRKAELVEDQLAAPPYGTNLTFPLEQYTRYSQTSGTTGTPLRWLDTAESWNWMVERWLRVFEASGVGPADRLFFAFSFGPFLGFWTAFDAGIRLGALCIPGGGMSTPARARALVDNRATVLCCTPTYAVHLGEVARDEGLDLARSALRTVLVAGEPGAGVPATRARIEGLFPGARLWDHHGMTETGPVTFECPVRQGVLHVMEEAFIPEVIDPETGLPLGPGATGELVLTNLGRMGSPLLRYRTGDLVRRAAREECECGRWELALEGGILGRVDDMVLVRGVNVYPSACEDLVRRFESVAEYQVEVVEEDALTELRLRVEPVPGLADPRRLEQELASAFRTALNLRVPVTAVAPGSLPRYELKAKRWVRVEAGHEGTGSG